MASRTDFDLFLKTTRGLIKPTSFNGVVYLIKNEDFEIVLVNNSNLKVQAKVYLSGYDVGTLVLNPRQKLTLKKPVEGVDRAFRYCPFNSYESVVGKLNKENLYSDEINVVFMPEKLTEQTFPIYTPMDKYATANSKGIRVESDFSGGDDTVDNGGGVILGPNRTYQTFFRVDDFVTHGKYSFTLVMRTKCEDDFKEILPLCDMYANRFSV